MSTTNTAAADHAAAVITEPHVSTKRRAIKSYYPRSFFIPAILLYFVFFLIPSVASFYFSLTRWSLFDSRFIGLRQLRGVLPESAALHELHPHLDLRFHHLRG